MKIKISELVEKYSEEKNINKEDLTQMYNYLSTWVFNKMNSLSAPFISLGHINFKLRGHKLKDTDHEAKEMVRKYNEKDYDEWK